MSSLITALTHDSLLKLDPLTKHLHNATRRLPEYYSLLQKSMIEFRKLSKLLERIPSNVCVEHISVRVGKDDGDMRRKRF